MAQRQRVREEQLETATLDPQAPATVLKQSRLGEQMRAQRTALFDWDDLDHYDRVQEIRATIAGLDIPGADGPDAAAELWATRHNPPAGPDDTFYITAATPEKVAQVLELVDKLKDREVELIKSRAVLPFTRKPPLATPGCWNIGCEGFSMVIPQTHAQGATDRWPWIAPSTAGFQVSLCGYCAHPLEDAEAPDFRVWTFEAAAARHTHGCPNSPLLRTLDTITYSWQARAATNPSVWYQYMIQGMTEVEKAVLAIDPAVALSSQMTILLNAQAGLTAHTAAVQQLNWPKWIIIAVDVANYTQIKLTPKHALLADRCADAIWQIAMAKLLGNIVKAGVMAPVRWWMNSWNEWAVQTLPYELARVNNNLFRLVLTHCPSMHLAVESALRCTRHHLLRVGSTAVDKIMSDRFCIAGPVYGYPHIKEQLWMHTAGQRIVLSGPYRGVPLGLFASGLLVQTYWKVDPQPIDCEDAPRSVLRKAGFEHSPKLQKKYLAGWRMTNEYLLAHGQQLSERFAPNVVRDGCREIRKMQINLDKVINHQRGNFRELDGQNQHEADAKKLLSFLYKSKDFNDIAGRVLVPGRGFPEMMRNIPMLETIIALGLYQDYQYVQNLDCCRRLLQTDQGWKRFDEVTTLWTAGAIGWPLHMRCCAHLLDLYRLAQAAVNVGAVRCTTQEEQATAGMMPNFAGIELYVEDAVILMGPAVREEAGVMTRKLENFREFKKGIARHLLDAEALETGQEPLSEIWAADDGLIAIAELGARPAEAGPLRR